MTDKELQFFDTIAREWDSMEVLSLPEKVSSILDACDVEPGMHILDLGTGTGVLLPELARRVGSQGQITAVDISSGMLAEAVRKNADLSPTPEFLCRDIEKDTLEGRFHRIFLYCVYPHLESPLATISRLRNYNLLPGGRIIIAFPCSEEFINNIHNEKEVESEQLPTAPLLVERLNAAGLSATVIDYSPDQYIISVC